MSWIGALKDVILPTLTFAMLAWLIIALEGMHCEISKIKAELARIEATFDRIDAKLAGNNMHTSGEKHRVSRHELWQELHRQLEIRFDESDESVAYGGPGLAVDRLLLRAKPDVDVAFADILASPRSEPPMLLTQDISNDLWERRIQFLEPPGPTTPLCSPPDVPERRAMISPARSTAPVCY